MSSSPDPATSPASCQSLSVSDPEHQRSCQLSQMLSHSSASVCLVLPSTAKLVINIPTSANSARSAQDQQSSQTWVVSVQCSFCFCHFLLLFKQKVSELHIRQNQY